MCDPAMGENLVPASAETRMRKKHTDTMTAVQASSQRRAAGTSLA
jgi:hypothetical protein